MSRWQLPIAFSVMVLLCSCSWAATYYVDPDGIDDANEPHGIDPDYPFKTIQFAINVANDGDVVLVNKGTYSEYVNFNGISCTVSSTNPHDWSVVENTIIDSNVLYCVAFNGGEDANTLLIGFTIEGATSYGIFIGDSSPTIANCIIDTNGTDAYGIYNWSSNASVIKNNKIKNNHIGIFNMGSSIIKNNLIYNNHIGVHLFSASSSVLRNNTIVKNNSYGVGITRGYPAATITNCVIWGNDSNDLHPHLNATYSCIQDPNDANGMGNITGDSNNPDFINADANDFHLKLTSPCIDKGDPNGNYYGEFDIDNETRVKGNNIDMGADEGGLDVDVDSNRDTYITSSDDYDEDTWSVGPNSVGAIVLPNCDKDNTDTIAPDNWIGGDWNCNGVNEPDEMPNYHVDGPNDIKDLAELWVYKLGYDSFPDDLTITLSVAAPTDVHNAEYFSQVSPKDRIRIFLPTDSSTEPGNLIIQPNDTAIIGPEASNTFVFLKTGNPNDASNYDKFLGTGIVKFGVEGIEFGSYVDITVSVESDSCGIDISDTVRMRVAPFVLSDFTMPIDVNYDSDKTVFVSKTLVDGNPNSYPNNVEYRNALGDIYGNHLDVAEVTTGTYPYSQNIWHNDDYEVGYTKAPYGQMPIFLTMPYSGNLPYVHNNRLINNVGVCCKFEKHEFNICANINSKPDVNKPGSFVHGLQLDPKIVDFFEAQNVNSNMPVDVNWTAIGHCDTALSYSPTGKTFVTDTEICWALLLWAKDINENAHMLRGVPAPLGGTPNEGSFVTVSSVINNNDYRTYNLITLMEPSKLGGVLEDPNLDLESPESSPVRDGNNLSSTILKKAGAFIGFFPDNNDRYYQIDFTDPCDANKYIVKWSENPDVNWNDANTYDVNLNDIGDVNQDCIFEQALCFVFKHWWWADVNDDSNTPEPNYQDKFTFFANPNCNTLEMPQLFYQDYKYFQGRAGDYTINHVDAVVDKNVVFTGRAYGPPVLNNCDPDDPNDDILMAYVKGLFEKAGYTEPNSIIDVDSRVYQWGGGSIWCGTNMIREIPDYNWWDFEPNAP
jgi:parallel beta-helix repeat protein